LVLANQGKARYVEGSGRPLLLEHPTREGGTRYPICMLALRRVASLVVDLTVAAAAAGLASIPILVSGERGWGVFALLMLVTSGAAFVGFAGPVVLGALSGRSVGQRLLGLRVVGNGEPVTRARLSARLTVFYAAPAFLVLGAVGASTLAVRRIDAWGSTHPDWQSSYDAAAREQDEANDRVLHTRIGSPEYLRAWDDQVEGGNRMGQLIAERDATRTGWLARSGDALGLEILLAWATANGALLFTRRGPLHDRLLGTRVEHGRG
jgi:hypothetical protein